jgi:hypothetical protein
MFNPRQTIIIQGEEVKLLFTFGLYPCASERKISLVLKDSSDTSMVWSIYVRYIYLAYLNALEKDDIDRGKSHKRADEYSLGDFEVWAQEEDSDRFWELCSQIVEWRTGKKPSEVIEQKKKHRPL